MGVRLPIKIVLMTIGVFGLLVYFSFERLFLAIGIGSPWPCMATIIFIIGLILALLIMYGSYKAKKAKKESIRIRANEIMPEPCPICRTPLAHRKDFGFYCERCMKYVDR